MPGQHARLAASSAARWINCPPSAMLAEQFPETNTKYTAAGTLAHAIAELKARKYFIEPMSAKSFNAKLKKLKADPAYDAGMDHATDVYLDELKRIAMQYDETPFVALEVRVDYSHIAPEGFGTADCIMIAGQDIHVIDYKNGSGVIVEAEENPQMMLYAVGALKVYAPIFGDAIRNVFLHIVQPNAGGIREWELDKDWLLKWAQGIVAPAAQQAYNGEGEFHPGAWCDDHFCPARATCMARAAKLLGLEEDAGVHPMPQLIPDDEIGDVLTRALSLQKWVNALQEYAFNAAMSGRRIAGYKLVEGRTNRDWADQDEAFATLESRGVPEALLWERKPASVAGLEKALGKHVFAEAADGLVVRKPGKPALVPESDKRPEWTPAEAAFEVVEE